jgi:hypothetical protein
VNREDFKKMMNPLEWLKTLYGAFGAKNPTASLVIVMIVAAMIGGAVWKFGAYLYQKDLAKVPAAITQPQNTTNGPQSPIMPNNSGVVTITNEPKQSAPPPAKNGSKKHAAATKMDKSP